MLALCREKTARGVREGRAEGGFATGGMGDVRGHHRIVGLFLFPQKMCGMCVFAVEKRRAFSLSLSLSLSLLYVASMTRVFRVRRCFFLTDDVSLFCRAEHHHQTTNRDERGFLIGEEEEEECEQRKKRNATTRRREGSAAAEEKDEEERSPIDLTRADEEDEPQPLAWRLLRKAVEKRCEERETEEEEEDGDKTRPLSSPPDYSTKSEEELAKELEKFGMKRLGSRKAMIDCLMNVWIEKMVERGDGAAYSQRLEEELLSLSQRDQNVGTDESGEVKRKKRKHKHSSDLVGRKTTAREENDFEDERAFHAKLTSFLKSSRAMYATILRMEPIDLDKVKKLCEDGLRVKCISKVKLVSYFESKGVAVRHNTMKKKNARRHFSPIVEEELH